MGCDQGVVVEWTQEFLRLFPSHFFCQQFFAFFGSQATFFELNEASSKNVGTMTREQPTQKLRPKKYFIRRQFAGYSAGGLSRIAQKSGTNIDIP